MYDFCVNNTIEVVSLFTTSIILFYIKVIHMTFTRKSSKKMYNLLNFIIFFTKNRNLLKKNCNTFLQQGELFQC